MSFTMASRAFAASRSSIFVAESSLWASRRYRPRPKHEQHHEHRRDADGSPGSADGLAAPVRFLLLQLLEERNALIGCQFSRHDLGSFSRAGCQLTGAALHDLPEGGAQTGAARRAPGAARLEAVAQHLVPREVPVALIE